MEENGIELLDAESLDFSIFRVVSSADGVYLGLSWRVQPIVEAIWY